MDRRTPWNPNSKFLPNTGDLLYAPEVNRLSLEGKIIMINNWRRLAEKVAVEVIQSLMTGKIR